MDDLIGRVVDLQDGRAGRCVGRVVLSLGQRRDKAEHRDKGHGRASSGHRFLSFWTWVSAFGGQMRERRL